MVVSGNAFALVLSLGLVSSASAAPTVLSARALSAADLLANGQAAQKLNAQFASLTATSSCNDGDQGCVGSDFAQCVGGTFQASACSGGTQCFALPLVNSKGTSVTCDTQADAEARIQATGATGGITGDGSAGNSTAGGGGAGTDSSPSGAGDSVSSSVIASSGAGGVSTAVVGDSTTNPSSPIETSLGATGSEVLSSVTDAAATATPASSETSLHKRQDAIGDVQSTVVPISAITTGAESTASDTTIAAASTSAATQSGVTTSSTAAAADSTATTSAVTGAGSESGATGDAAGQTVTVTVTVTPGAAGATSTAAPDAASSISGAGNGTTAGAGAGDDEPCDDSTTSVAGGEGTGDENSTSVAGGEVSLTSTAAGVDATATATETSLPGAATGTAEGAGGISSTLEASSISASSTTLAAFASTPSTSFDSSEVAELITASI